MQKIKEPWRFLFVYSSFIAIAAIFILVGMLLSPSEASNSLSLGLSLPRLILASGWRRGRGIFPVMRWQEQGGGPGRWSAMEEWVSVRRMRRPAARRSDRTTPAAPLG